MNVHFCKGPAGTKPAALLTSSGQLQRCQHGRLLKECAKTDKGHGCMMKMLPVSEICGSALDVKRACPTIKNHRQHHCQSRPAASVCLIRKIQATITHTVEHVPPALVWSRAARCLRIKVIVHQ